jgi:D-alanine-D-alanine ligase
MLPESLHYTTITEREGRQAGFHDDELGEFDWECDLQFLEQTLHNLGIQPIKLPGAGASLTITLAEAKPPLLWNLNSGLRGPTREAQVPVLCGILGIPLIGSGAWTAFMTQDKTLAAELVKTSGVAVSVPKGTALRTWNDFSRLHQLEQTGTFFVKPNGEGSSRGISKASIVKSPSRLRAQCQTIFRQWGAVRVEQFVDGWDISANASIGPDGNISALEPVLLRHPDGIYTGAMKNRLPTAGLSQRTALREVDKRLAVKVQEVVGHLVRLFSFRHYARFDLRFDPRRRKIFFLEANLCPSFSPDDDFMLSAELSGMSFQETIRNIIAAGFRDARNSNP